MLSLTDLKSRKAYRTRKMQIEKTVAYRQASRRLDRSEASVEKLIAAYRRRAEEAERAGSHAQAVHFAGEAAKLMRHLAVSSQMRNTVETVYAVEEGSQALMEAMEAAGQLADDAVQGMDTEGFARAQLAYEMGREQVDMLMEESDEAFGGMGEEDDGTRAKGEAYLRDIMKTRLEAEKKRSRILQDTNRKLDELLKNRTSENQDRAGG